jgi:GAF domain-containing protein
MLTAFAAGLITLLVLSFAIRNQMRAGFQERLLDVATLASQRIDGDLHASLVDPSQENGLEYNRVKQVLQEIRNINPEEYRFVYTLRFVDDQVLFVVDAETNPNDISHLGSNYSDVSPVVLQNISNVTGPFVDQDFYTDQWGTFLSGYAPIYTSDGRLDGIVAVDISAATVLAAERRTFLLAGLVFMIVVPLIGLLGYRFGRRLAAPILQVIRGAERLASGDLKYRIHYEGWDELGRLTEVFNELAERLSMSIADLEGTITERTREVEQRFEYLQTAADVGATVGAILDPNRLISQVTNVIQSRFSLYYVGLFLVDETGDWAVLRAATGEAGEKMLARGHRIRVGEGMIGWSVANNQARVASQAEKDAVRLKTPELPLTRSEAAIPLRARERVLGALSVQSDQPDAFDRTAIFVLQTMADQIAVALDNARLLSQRQSELEDIQRSYQQLTQSAWDTLLQSRGLVGYRADEQGLSPVEQMVIEEEEIEKGISDDGLTLTLPVRVRGQILGYLQAARPASTLAWTEEDLNLVESLIDQLGISLDNARLYSATQRSADRERILSGITGRVRSSTSVDAILQTAVRQLSEALKVPRGAIRLVTGPQSDNGEKGSGSE